MRLNGGLPVGSMFSLQQKLISKVIFLLLQRRDIDVALVALSILHYFLLACCTEKCACACVHI